MVSRTASDGAPAPVSPLPLGAADAMHVLDRLPDVVVCYDAEGVVTWASASLRSVLGWDPDQVVGTELRLSVPSGRDAVEEAVRASNTAGSDITHVRFEAVRRDGSRCWVDCRSSAIRDADGAVSGAVASYRDVSDEVERERRLIAVTDELRATLDSELDPHARLVGVRDDKGRIVDFEYADANESALAYLGMERHDLIGSRLLGRWPHLPPGLVERYVNVVETGEPMLLDDHLLSGGATGQLRWYDVRGVRVGDGLSLSWRDVTTRHMVSSDLNASQELYRMIAENSSDVVIRASLDGRFEWVSPSVTDVLGWSPKDLVGELAADFVHPDDVSTSPTPLDNQVEGRLAFRVRMRDHEGQYHWVDTTFRPATDSTGQLVARVGSVRLADAEVAAVHDLERSERRFRLAMDSSPVAMALVDLDRKFTRVNPALCRLLDCDAEWLLTRGIADILGEEDDRLDLVMRVQALASPHAQDVGEKRLIRPDGSEAWVEHSFGVVRDDDGTPVSYVSQFVDIADARHTRETLAFQATHDNLTRLVNQRELHRRLSTILSHAARAGTTVGVLYVDVDGLKPINDSLGHSAGDALLVEIAHRLESSVRAEDTVARVGGDEFVVLLPELHSPQDAELVARKIHGAMDRPMRLHDTEIAPSVSIGIATPHGHQHPDDVIAAADRALYDAKHSGGHTTAVSEG